ncbi:MAG: mechanosensitive ion channel family protein [Acidimicrobiia bacterium]|nr:mechanosensitive ion channel family protein [Acidimicrobiia bacterium]
MQDTTEAVETPLEAACGSSPNIICEWVFEGTDSEVWAKLADWFLDRPLRILFILFLAWLLVRVLQAMVHRFADELAERGARPVESSEKSPRRNANRIAHREQQRVRAQRRAVTLGVMLDSLVSILVWTTAGFMVLGELGVSLGPLIASAGIAGIALGFGAQSVVRDFLAGIFVIVEDQYGVGDVIDVGEAIGTVEEVGFRTTLVRDVSGVLWTVPNGVIQRVGNYSQIWSKSIFDIEVAYDTDIDQAMEVIKHTLDEVWQENLEEATIIEEPEVQGVQAFGESAVVIRAAVKTDPAEQWTAARIINGRLKKALDEAEIEIPFPQRTVWVKNDDGASLKRD